MESTAKGNQNEEKQKSQIEDSLSTAPNQFLNSSNNDNNNSSPQNNNIQPKEPQKEAKNCPVDQQVPTETHHQKESGSSIKKSNKPEESDDENSTLSSLEQLSGGRENLQKMFVQGAQSNELSFKDLVAMAGGEDNLKKIFASANMPMPIGAKVVPVEEREIDKNFLTACYKQDLTEAEKLLSEGADINAKDRTYGYSSLHSAVYEEKVSVVEFLLKKGANPNFFNRHGETPLHSAAYIGAEKCVELLLQFKADPNQQKGHVAQYTPVLCACISKKPSTKLLRMLLEAGGNPQLKNEKGLDAVDLARNFENLTLVSVLQENYSSNLQPQEPTKKPEKPDFTSSDLQDPSKLGIKKMKEILAYFQIDYSGASEKSDLVELFKKINANEV